MIIWRRFRRLPPAPVQVGSESHLSETGCPVPAGQDSSRRCRSPRPLLRIRSPGGAAQRSQRFVDHDGRYHLSTRWNPPGCEHPTRAGACHPPPICCTGSTSRRCCPPRPGEPRLLFGSAVSDEQASALIYTRQRQIPDGSQHLPVSGPIMTVGALPSWDPCWTCPQATAAMPDPKVWHDGSAKAADDGAGARNPGRRGEVPHYRGDTLDAWTTGGPHRRRQRCWRSREFGAMWERPDPFPWEIAMCWSAARRIAPPERIIANPLPVLAWRVNF